MAIITVQMYPGRDVETKRALTKAITDAMVDVAGATRERCYVVIHEIEPENWSFLGRYALDDELTQEKWTGAGTEDDR